MTHSPFPWSTHPQMPTCVYNADGMKISEAIGPDAEDNAALIAAIPAMVEALAMFLERVERHGNWDDGCFYYGATSASELQMPMELTRAILASIGKTP